MIRVTSLGTDEVEEFVTVEDLENDFHKTADKEYARTVLNLLKNGSRVVEVQNGPDLVDIYEVIE